MKKLFSASLILLVLSMSIALSQTEKITIHKVTGLNNALLKVDNEKAVEAITNNIEKIRDKLEITNSTELNLEETEDGFEVEIKRKAKLFNLNFMEITLSEKAVLDKDGNVKEHKKGFWRRVLGFVSKIEDG